MPIYEYKCQECGYRFEVRQDFDDDALTECRNNGCHGPVRRLFSPPAIIFKGSGFHITDYGRGTANGPRSGKPSDEPSPSDKDKVGSQDKTE